MSILSDVTTTLSTLAQLLAAVVAITAVFVLQKSEDYRVNMKREMRNLHSILVRIRNASPIHRPHFFPDWTEFDRFTEKVQGAEVHGPFNELEGIFITGNIVQTNLLPFTNQERHISDANLAVENGKLNCERRKEFLARFADLAWFGFSLVSIDLFCLVFCPQIIREFLFFLILLYLDHGLFLLRMAQLIYSGTQGTEK